MLKVCMMCELWVMSASIPQLYGFHQLAAARLGRNIAQRGPLCCAGLLFRLHYRKSTLEMI